MKFSMKDLPFFYIMVQTFNRPELVIRSIKSLVEQSYSNYKVILFNDGSTNDYTELEKLIDGNSKIEYIKSSNVGINKSGNIILELFLQYSNGNNNDYFFILNDDDYLVEDSLKIMADEIAKKSSIWYCFNCKSNSKEKFNNTYYLNYEILSYSNFEKSYRGDKHFVFKLNKFKKIRFAEKYFKNGYLNLFYYQIPSKIQTVPSVVKIIEYYDDGITLSSLYKNRNTLDIQIKELKTLPFKWILYRKFIMFYMKPKNIIKVLISEDKYYKIKKGLGLKNKKNRIN